MTALEATHTTRRRVLFSATGLLLTLAVALNVASLTSISWITEDTGIATKYPVALLETEAEGYYGLDSLNATNSAMATYLGMRASAFRVCFTLADTTVRPFMEKESCHTYHSDSYFPKLQRFPVGYASKSWMKMCSFAKYPRDYELAGIPLASALPPLLQRFCGFHGSVVIVLQIGGPMTAFVALAAWALSVCSRGPDHKSLVATVFAACVSAALMLATIFFWAGVLHDSATSLGSNVTLTIMALVAVVVAATTAHLCPRKVLSTGAGGASSATDALVQLSRTIALR